MKICIISFDYWKFDSHIANELLRRGHEVTHIDVSRFKYRYKSVLERVKNTLGKTFFGKNIKVQKRQEYVLHALNKLPHQDIILVIRPDLFTEATHRSVKAYTDEYIAYLYDSTTRFSINHLPNGIFDRIYSFDPVDVEKYGYMHISNYIYMQKKPLTPHKIFEFDAFIVISKDERLPVLNKIATALDRIQKKYKFILCTSADLKKIHTLIQCQKNTVCINSLTDYLGRSKVFVDIVRFGHHGLSFRVFEALAYQHKLITTNQSVKQYDFYNPQNILVVDNTENIEINDAFFKTPYVPLPDEVYQKYTVENWVETVFFKKTELALPGKAYDKVS